MNELNKRKKEFLKAYNNLCSCYGDIISEQTKVSCNILAEKVKLQQQLAIAVEALNWYDGLEKMLIGWEIATGQERGTAEKALCEIEELDKCEK